MRVRKLLGVALVATMTTLAASAQTHSATATLGVTTTVEATCTITTAPIDFGIMYASADWKSAQGTITVNCTNGMGYTVYLTPGNAGPSGGGIMKDTDLSTRTAEYFLYQNSTLSTEWTDVAFGGVDGVGTGSDSSHTVYSKARPVDMFSSGAVSDVVTVTVQF